MPDGGSWGKTEDTQPPTLHPALPVEPASYKGKIWGQHVLFAVSVMNGQGVPGALVAISFLTISYLLVICF